MYLYKRNILMLSIYIDISIFSFISFKRGMQNSMPHKELIHSGLTAFLICIH